MARATHLLRQRIPAANSVPNTLAAVGAAVQQARLDASLGMLLVLGVGSTLSVAAHAVAQLIGAYRLGLPVRVRRGWRTDPDVAVFAVAQLAHAFYEVSRQALFARLDTTGP